MITASDEKGKTLCFEGLQTHMLFRTEDKGHVVDLLTLFDKKNTHTSAGVLLMSTSVWFGFVDKIMSGNVFSGLET